MIGGWSTKFQEKLERESKRARLVPLWIRIPFIAAPFILTFYWMITFDGLYEWLSDVQADLFGNEYYPILSFAFTLFILLIPAVFVIRGLIPFYERRALGRDDVIDQL